MLKCKRNSTNYDGQIMAHPAMLCSKSALDIKFGDLSRRAGQAMIEGKEL